MAPSRLFLVISAIFSCGPCLAQEIFVPENPNFSFTGGDLFTPSGQIFMRSGPEGYRMGSPQVEVPGQLVDFGIGTESARIIFGQPNLEQMLEMQVDGGAVASMETLPFYQNGFIVALEGKMVYSDFQFDLGKLSLAERTEYQDLVARYDQLSPLELNRLEELNKKGLTVIPVGGPSPPPDPTPIIIPLRPKPPRKCIDGREIPKWCEQVVSKSEFCRCPED